MKYGVYVLMFFVGGGYALIKTWQTSASIWMKILWTLNLLSLPIASAASGMLARRNERDTPLA